MKTSVWVAAPLLAASFSTHAMVTDWWGAYAAAGVSTNCPSFCTSQNGGEFLATSDGGLLHDTARATWVESFADGDAYASILGGAYLPDLKVRAYSEVGRKGSGYAFGIQGFTYLGPDTTFNLFLDLHGTAEDAANSGYHFNVLQGSVAVLFGEDIDFFTTHFATLVYEGFSGDKLVEDLFLSNAVDAHDTSTVSFPVSSGQSFIIVATLTGIAQNGYVDAWNTLTLDFVDDEGTSLFAEGGIAPEFLGLYAGSQGPAPVPVPAAIWMLGSGLAGLVWGRGRRAR